MCNGGAAPAKRSASGLAMFVEKSGLGPFDGVRVTVDTSGAVEVVTGAASVGQGVETVIAQICADALGVDYRRMRVVHGQTDRIAYGMGAFASRVTVMTGEATRLAASKVRAKAIEVAAELLQAPPDPLDIVDGKVVRTDAGAGPSIALGEVARHLSPASKIAGRTLARADRRRLVPHRPHELPLRRARRRGAGRSRDRRGRRWSAISSPTTSAGRSIRCWSRDNRRRRRAGPRRRAARGVPLRRARRAAVGHVRRLSDADGARNAPGRRHHHRRRAEPAQSAGPEGRGRGRHQRGRRRDRRRDRRCDRHCRRGHAAAGHAAAAARAAAKRARIADRAGRSIRNRSPTP